MTEGFLYSKKSVLERSPKRFVLLYIKKIEMSKKGVDLIVRLRGRKIPMRVKKRY